MSVQKRGDTVFQPYGNPDCLGQYQELILFLIVSGYIVSLRIPGTHCQSRWFSERHQTVNSRSVNVERSKQDSLASVLSSHQGDRMAARMPDRTWAFRTGER